MPAPDATHAPTLLERIARGDADAVKDLLDQYSGLVRSLSRRHFDPGLAEDVVQEIFLSLWKSAARFDPARSSEAAFVTTIARRRMIDLRRRRARRPETELDEDADFAAPPFADVTEQAESVRAALAAVATLKPAAREVLRMAVIDGMTHEEIASTTHMPLGTVKSHARRGLERVRALLQGDDDE